MSRFFSSDFHFGSTLINKYAHRPFTSAQDAVSNIVSNVNDTLEETDVLFHVGDFQLLGHDRHGEIDDRGLDFTQNDYLKMLKCRTILLSGNHDDGHNTTADAKSMTINLNQNYVNVTVAHYPSTHDFYRYVGNNNRASCDVSGGDQNTRIHIHLCGHVHQSWFLMYDAEHNVLNVNVGLDCHGYRPIRDSEITEILDIVFGKRIPGFGMKFDRTWYETRKSYDEWVKSLESDVKKRREDRKQERYAKKGLTKEECERRKQEGIKLSRIKKLHMITSAGMTNCKQALDECGYDDLKKAKAWLDEHGFCICQKNEQNVIEDSCRSDEQICQVWSPGS